MEHVLINLAGKARQVGTDIVAPLTLIVPGVLNGSKGPLLYPADEVAKSPSAWDGQPLVVNHPFINGIPVSAHTPGVPHIGTVRNARVTSAGKLTAEGWFSVDATRRADSRILTALQSGQPLELSTGLFTDNVPAVGTHNGVRYEYIARNYRPDHVAILPDHVGACSLRHGCGVLVNCGCGRNHSPVYVPSVNKPKGVPMNSDNDVLRIMTFADLLDAEQSGPAPVANLDGQLDCLPVPDSTAYFIRERRREMRELEERTHHGGVTTANATRGMGHGGNDGLPLPTMNWEDPVISEWKRRGEM